MDPVTLGLAIGGGVLGTAASAAQAVQQNRAIERSIASQRRAAAIQQQQIADAAALERLKALRTAQQIQGRIRVAAGEAGVSTGGSFAALDRQAAFDAALNRAIIDRNAANQMAAVRSQYQAAAIQLQSQASNPLLAAFDGGLAGLQTGLAIGGVVNSLGQLATEAPKAVTTGDFPTIANNLA